MRTLFAFLLAALALPIASADDWPQWMGPKRDNVWREKGIVEKLPKTPKVVWRAPVAGGYAGPAVVGDRLYVTDFVRSGEAAGDNFERTGIPGTERVLCLNATTGKEVWKHEYPVTYTISYPAGPRCTPLVHEGTIYTLGSEGHLIAFEAASGKVVWSKALKEEYGTTAPLWGYAAHPLIDGEKLITLAGGEGSQVVALHKDTGKELWRSLDTPEIGQGYVPPSIIEAGGTRQLLILKPDALCSIDPESGKLFWSVPYEADNGAVIMTPVHAAGHVYAGGFNGKNVVVKLEENRPAAKTVWKDDRQLGVSPINVQPFPAGDLIYGINADGMLTCFKVPSGERLWESPQPVGSRPANSGTAFLIRQGESPERCWMFTDSGDLVLGKLSPEKFEELSRAHVIEPTNSAFNRDVVWCSPAFANRRFYVRNDKECICVDLAASPRQASAE